MPNRRARPVRRDPVR